MPARRRCFPKRESSLKTRGRNLGVLPLLACESLPRLPCCKDILPTKLPRGSRCSVQKKPKEPTFFSNRAITRMKLENWAGVEQDARAAIDLYGAKNPASLKSRYYLAQALLELQRPQEAHEVATEAYQASLAAKNVQSENLSKTVLRAKQQLWAAKEAARVREMNGTLASVERLIEADLQRALEDLQGKLDRGEIGQIGFSEDQKALREDTAKTLQVLRETFAIASKGEVQERVSFLT